MKRFSAVVICLILMISILTLSGLAAEIEGVITLPGDDGTGYPATGITDSYSYDKDVRKVIVPENIVRLGEQAF